MNLKAKDSLFANGKEHAPIKHWKPIAKLPRAGDKITFQLIISTGSMEVTIQNNGESFPFKTNISNGEYRILTFVCYMTSALFRFNVIK